MKHIKTEALRVRVQAFVILALATVVILYDLYTQEVISFRLLRTADLNPYGGWSVLHGLATDSSYVFEGISRSIALTIALIACSILGGRFFCGWLCPLGAMQDLSSRLGERLLPKGFSKCPDRPDRFVWLKYAILLAVLLASVFGYGGVLAGISPWRAILGLPGLASAWEMIKWGVILLIILLTASIFIPRAFCRYLCPLGAVQALFGSHSLFRLEYRKACSSCRQCMKKCPSGIKLTEDNGVMSPECIRCMACLEGCRSGSGEISLRAGNRKAHTLFYVASMTAIFFLLWLALPLLWGGSGASWDVELGNLKDGHYEGTAKGFAGDIITEVTVEGGRVTGIRVTEHQESKGWYEEAFMKIPRSVLEKQRLPVDAVSGATKTSRGLVNSIENALKKAR